MRSTGKRSPIRERRARLPATSRHTEGNGDSRSPLRLTPVLAVACLLLATAASAQLEVLLRGVPPTEPRRGACGLYRFQADEPDGSRQQDFHVCIESVASGADGTVQLRLWSGDSLEARVDIDRAMFGGAGGALLEHVRRVVQVERGTTREMQSDEWQDIPALRPAPQLPVVADSTWEGVRHPGTGLQCRGRFLEEARESTQRMGEADVLQSERRTLEVLTSPAAPILGVVRARATVRSERRFSQPIPGVPQRGPRESHYALELLVLESKPPR